MAASPPPTPKYFVESSGQQFGPADLELLRRWAMDGRVSPDSILVEVVSGRRLAARELPDLFHPGISATPIFGETKRFPIWAIILWAFGTLCALCLAAILFPVFQSARVVATRATGLSHMKAMGLAALMYANDNDDHFPPKIDTALEAKTYLSRYVSKVEREDIFQSKNGAGGGIKGNRWLDGVSTDRVADPASTPMFYDERPWGDRGLACYVDGHSKFSPYKDLMRAVSKDPIDHSRTSPAR